MRTGCRFKWSAPFRRLPANLPFKCQKSYVTIQNTFLESIMENALANSSPVKTVHLVRSGRTVSLKLAARRRRPPVVGFCPVIFSHLSLSPPPNKLITPGAVAAAARHLIGPRRPVGGAWPMTRRRRVIGWRMGGRPGLAPDLELVWAPLAEQCQLL